MKILHHSGILSLLLFMLPAKTICQDLIYKTDGTVLNVEIVAIDGPTIKFKLPGDPAGTIHFLSNSAIDSLRDYKSRTTTFPKTVVPVKTIKRNYIGTDLFNMFLLNPGFSPNIFYERLSASGNLGYSAELLINLNKKEETWSVEDFWKFTSNIFPCYGPFDYFMKFGCNYYPFSYSLKKTGFSRVWMGASLLLGQYSKEDYTDYNYTPKKKFGAVISYNLGIKAYLSNSFLLKADCELSVLPFLVFIIPEAGITIAF